MRVTDKNSAYCGAIGTVIGHRDDPSYPMTRLQIMADPMPGERWFLDSNLKPLSAEEGDTLNDLYNRALSH